MTEKARHATGRMMFGQPIGGQHKWKSRIARRREPIVITREPVHRRIGVVRIKFIRDRGLERLVMSWQWSVLQTFWHVKPAQAVLMQDKRRVTGDCIQAFRAYLRLVIGS